MNFQISVTQAQKFACEIIIADIKKFIADHPKEYQLYLEGQAIPTGNAKN